MEVAGKIPPGFGPGGRFAVGIMLADRDRRPTSEVERRRLSTAVSSRGWQLSVRFGAATALAELCLVDREEAAREAWGLPRRLDLVLLLAGDVLGSSLATFVRAVRSHAPRTRIYRWTGADIVPFDRTTESRGGARADAAADDGGRGGPAAPGRAPERSGPSGPSGPSEPSEPPGSAPGDGPTAGLETGHGLVAATASTGDRPAAPRRDAAPKANVRPERSAVTTP
jgi:hypothetical protein